MGLPGEIVWVVAGLGCLLLGATVSMLSLLVDTPAAHPVGALVAYSALYFMMMFAWRFEKALAYSAAELTGMAVVVVGFILVDRLVRARVSRRPQVSAVLTIVLRFACLGLIAAYFAGARGLWPLVAAAAVLAALWYAIHTGFLTRGCHDLGDTGTSRGHAAATGDDVANYQPLLGCLVFAILIALAWPLYWFLTLL